MRETDPTDDEVRELDVIVAEVREAQRALERLDQRRETLLSQIKRFGDRANEIIGREDDPAIVAERQRELARAQYLYAVRDSAAADLKVREAAAVLASLQESDDD